MTDVVIIQKQSIVTLVQGEPTAPVVSQTSGPVQVLIQKEGPGPKGAKGDPGDPGPPGQDGEAGIPDELDGGNF